MHTQKQGYTKCHRRWPSVRQSERPQKKPNLSTPRPWTCSFPNCLSPSSSRTLLCQFGQTNTTTIFGPTHTSFLNLKSWTFRYYNFPSPVSHNIMPKGRYLRKSTAFNKFIGEERVSTVLIKNLKCTICYSSIPSNLHIGSHSTSSPTQYFGTANY